MHRPDPMHHGSNIADLRVIRGRKREVSAKIGHGFSVAPEKKVDHGAIMDFLA